MTGPVSGNSTQVWIGREIDAYQAGVRDERERIRRAITSLADQIEHLHTGAMAPDDRLVAVETLRELASHGLLYQLPEGTTT